MSTEAFLDSLKSLMEGHTLSVNDYKNLIGRDLT